MLGMPMRVKGREFAIELRPPTREDIVKMAPFMGEETNRYLSRHLGQNADTEATWYEKIIKDSDKTVWGIFVKDRGKWVHIGNTDVILHDEGYSSTGVLLHRKEYWGKGIISGAHLARTLYVHDVMDLEAVRSEVYEENITSRRAIERIGYVKVGTTYGRGFIQGRVQHADQFQWVNPSDRAWNHFWGDTKPPKKFLEGRKRALEALKRARQTVEFI